MNKRNLSKKEFELTLLKNFISNKDVNLRVKSISASESPDFIIETLLNNISVELTMLIHPQTKQKEEFQKELVEMAQSMFKKKYDEDLYVLVTFSDQRIKCKGIEKIKFANDLFGLVEEIYLSNRQYEFHVSSKKDYQYIDPYIYGINSYIDHISISNDKGFENWQPFGAFRVEYVDIDWLKNVIRKKEENLYEYRNDFEENWLLLIGNFGNKSSGHRFDHLRQERIKSDFDKVFLYQYRDEEIIQL